ncbi:hypothetical protein D3C77_344530 [compost metagenome]
MTRIAALPSSVSGSGRLFGALLLVTSTNADSLGLRADTTAPTDPNSAARLSATMLFDWLASQYAAEVAMTTRAVFGFFIAAIWSPTAATGSASPPGDR